MVICASICCTVSSATPTTMIIPVPWKATSRFEKCDNSSGNVDKIASARPPMNVILLTVLERY